MRLRHIKSITRNKVTNMGYSCRCDKVTATRNKVKHLRHCKTKSITRNKVTNIRYKVSIERNKVTIVRYSSQLQDTESQKLVVRRLLYEM